MTHAKSFTALFLIALALSAFTLPACAEQETEQDRLGIEHLFSLGAVSEPRVSPDKVWIAYTVTHRDLEEDESRSRVWMVSENGGEAVALTSDSESSWNPRWSPDGRYLAFLSARDDGPAQVWSLYRGGGEAVQLTDTAQAVDEFQWSPDSSRLLLVLRDASEEELARKEQGDDYEEETPKPWVIDRKQFKTDYVGYLDRRRTHVYVLDIQSKELLQVTDGDYDDSQAAWSPDGRLIAFTSNRTADPDGNYNTDIWVVAANGEGDPVRVTENPGPDAEPAWSPDGTFIAHTATTDLEAMLYATSHLAVSDASGQGTRLLTREIDRMVFSPRVASDGKAVWFLLEDAGEQQLARIAIENKKLDRIVRGEDVVQSFSFLNDDLITLVVSRPHAPAEVFTWSGGQLEQRSKVNHDVMQGLELGRVQKIRFASKDGTEIESFVVTPPGFRKGATYPVIMDIHGGPQSQYDYGFNFDAQLYAANGYLVVLPNPRGSTGYGQAFCLAIWQDWGGPDYDDVMAAIDTVIDNGWADPERMAVTGWSYGGILTNHVITKTGRFNAAAPGASATLYVVNYAHDMYQRWWDQELGYPWEAEARERYERISPFNHVDKVTTPTLILGGEKDWNVPIINSEQLYLALKKLGVETELVVYPGEFHGGFAPSNRKDLAERYLEWFGKYLEVD